MTLYHDLRLVQRPVPTLSWVSFGRFSDSGVDTQQHHEQCRVPKDTEESKLKNSAGGTIRLISEAKHAQWVRFMVVVGIFTI